MKKLSIFMIITAVVSLNFTSIYGYWTDQLNAKIKIPVIHDISIEITDCNIDDKQDHCVFHESTNEIIQAPVFENTQATETNVAIDSSNTTENINNENNSNLTNTQEEVNNQTLSTEEVENDKPETTD